MNRNAMGEFKGTVFVVDDDVLMRGMLEKSLRRANFNVELIAGGREALDRLQSVQPDLMLLDIDMPEVNGLDVLRRVRENPATRKVPVILLTGSVPDADQIIGILALDPSDFITKVISAKELVARIKWVLRRSTQA